MANADAYYPDAKIADDYELEARFLPIALVHTLSLSPSERLYLAAAVLADKYICPKIAGCTG